MVKLTDILYSMTNILSKNFENIDVIVDDSEGIGDTCFYVQIVPFEETTYTNSSDLKEVMVSIKYFNENKIECYEIASLLSKLFSRSLKVNDRVLEIYSKEANFLKDEVGNFLDFLITIKYVESIEIAKDTSGLMKEINVNTNIRK